MKIHIIGASGSGKTYLSNKLAKEYNIPHFDLDDIQWNNQFGTYGIKNSPQKRNEELNAILEKDNWIIEGVYYAWCEKCFADADKIILLETSITTCKWRVIRRFIKRKLGREKRKKETIKSLMSLLNWMNKYHREDLIKINQILKKYDGKVERIG